VLQTLEFVAGLDAQFLYHHSAGKVVYLERFRLAPGRVQGCHQQGLQPLPQRMFLYQ